MRKKTWIKLAAMALLFDVSAVSAAEQKYRDGRPAATLRMEAKDLNKWDPKNKAVVLDGKNCTWSKKCIGLPSVVQMGKRLAIFYDAPEGSSTSHMKRHVGLAWLELPLSAPVP